MEYVIQTWKLGELVQKINDKEINLNPPYQRNPIWTKKTQQFLIKSIYDGMPIPNIFLNKLDDGKYDMVDGQQRTRAIDLYCKTDDINLGVADEVEFKTKRIFEYEIAVIIITKIDEDNDEYIDEFYYMVNSSGIKLNRPETLKAQFFYTNFLGLVEELTESQEFVELNIVPITSKKRMMDRDLVEELCALILYGITDKKSQVDKIYQKDIPAQDIENCKALFLTIIKKIKQLNDVKRISETRYRQRNDFYTLFSFIRNNDNLSVESLVYLYRILIVLEEGIRPIKDACKPLAEYAFNCVSQSNSAKARVARLDFLTQIFLNDSKSPNQSQEEIREYYPSDENYFTKIENYLTFEVATLEKAVLLIESV